MVFSDSHVKALLKEGAARAGQPPSGAEWRIAPDAITAAKERIEEFARSVGESGARAAAGAKRSTLKTEDVREAAGDAAGDAVGANP